jgi:putative acetyltransferase
MTVRKEVLTAGKDDYEEILEVWESSVRATHDFISDEDIEEMKPQILNQYLDMVELYCLKDHEGRIAGFLGVVEDDLAMLFVAAGYRGQSVGKTLLQFAVESKGSRKVDVNEQNEQAVGFYKHMGFRVVGRSPLDGQGRPFPLLHMEL